jgi:Domain of unknown function (DUF4167)
MRGRNRNKGPNPLTRTYESNGPDVKIRGTAQHVADKYAQLARDAQASGDPVSAENYLQHAEHYYRLIAAAQEQFRQQFGGYQRPFDEESEEEFEPAAPANGYAAPGGDAADPGMQPQPYENRGEGGDRQPRFDRGDRQDRRDRFQRPDQPRHGEPRHEFQRPDRDRQDFHRGDRRERGRDDEQPNGLPAFLTNPVRQPIAVDESGEGEAPSQAPEEASGEPNGRYDGRHRRRRRGRYGTGGRRDEGGAVDPGADFGSDSTDTPPVE